MKQIKISPSILSADFSCLATELEKASRAEYLHLDVMDGHFVPNLTFGAPLIKALRSGWKGVFDVHLMVENPDSYVEAMADAGVDIFTFHQESTIHINRTINNIKKHGMKAGMALVPSTSEDVLKYVLDDIDLILVMTVNPGFGGQEFLSSQLDKIRNIRNMIDDSGRDIELEVDGGINDRTAPLVIEAGADVLVAGSYIFKAKDYSEAIKKLVEPYHNS